MSRIGISLYLVLIPFILFACDTPAAYAQDLRYCGEPVRTSRGKILRSKTVLSDFKRLYPLPIGFDPRDFQINHAVPLVCGGCDSVENMIWMAKPAKTCGEWYCQDRHEQITMCPQNFHK